MFHPPRPEKGRSIRRKYPIREREEHGRRPAAALGGPLLHPADPPAVRAKPPAIALVAERDREVARLLASATRRRLLAVVARRPGLSVGELLAELDLGWGTLHHHLKRLERADLLHTSVAGRRRMVFPGAAETRPAGAAAQALLRGKTARRVAEAVLAAPGAGVEDAVAAVGGSPRAVYYHVKRLVQAGLVETARPSRYDGLSPTPLLVRLLAPGWDPAEAPGLEDNRETIASEGNGYPEGRPSASWKSPGRGL